MDRLGLINACLRSADHHSSSSYPALIALMEHLSVRKLVAVSFSYTYLYSAEILAPNAN